MKRKTNLKVATWLAAFLVVSVGVAALAFIPFAKEPSYQFVTAWGSQGSAAGQFNDPTGLALSGSELFVSDARNGRIQVFGLGGKFIRSFGKTGDKPGELGRPMNLAIFGDEVFVPEYFNDRIQVFDFAGKSKRIIGSSGSGPGEFNAPGGVAIDANGNLYVADFYNHRIEQLNSDGSFIRQWGTTGKSGIWSGQFGYPTDVAIGVNNRLLVADGYNDRIQVFDANGDFSSMWGGPLAMNIYGPFNGWFATVTSVATDRAGNVFVADFYNNRVQKFSADGTFLSSFGSKGSGPGQFLYPIALVVSDDGSVFVADYGNNRIQKWQPGQ